MENEDLYGVPVTGICGDMCPADEIELRDRERLVHWLEGFKTGKGRIAANRSQMVKAYSRPAAGKVDPRPCDLRPAEVLQKTVNYLLGCIAVREDRAWQDIYDFVFDRLRAVRQDMVIQRIEGEAAIDILQKIIRFHVYAGYRLCTKSMSVYDPKINDQHTQECLKRLLNLYKVVSLYHPCREEFESLYLLFNLGQTEALMHYYDLPTNIRCLPLVKRAYEISISHLLGNFIRCFKLIIPEDISHCKMFVCAAHRHIHRMQSKSLQTMSHGYNSKSFKFPVSKLCDLLWYEDTGQVVSACRAHGLEVKDGNSVLFLKSSFKYPDKPQIFHSSKIDKLLKSENMGSVLLYDGKEGESIGRNDATTHKLPYKDYWENN